MAIKQDDEFTPDENKAITGTALWIGGAMALVAGVAVYAGMQG